MSLYSRSFDSAEQPLPGVEVLELEPRMSIPEFEEFAWDLVIPAHWEMDGSYVPRAAQAFQLDKTIQMVRCLDKPRDPWAPDHHWHSDKSYWGKNQFATVMYAQRLTGQVAGTSFIDTTALLQAIERDFPGMTETLSHSAAIFTVRRYFEEILPANGSPEAIERTLEEHDASTLEEVAEMEHKKFPPKWFPALLRHPFRGETCTMIDDARVVDLTGEDEARSQQILKVIRDRFLNLPLEELRQRPYYHHHEWEEGQVVIWPQIGTLHRAEPSPPGEKQRDTLRLFIK